MVLVASNGRAGARLADEHLVATVLVRVLRGGGPSTRNTHSIKKLGSHWFFADFRIGKRNALFGSSASDRVFALNQPLTMLVPTFDRQFPIEWSE